MTPALATELEAAISEIGDSHESKREQGALDAYKHMLDGLQAL